MNASQAAIIDQLMAKIASMEERLRAVEEHRGPHLGAQPASLSPAPPGRVQTADELSGLLGRFVDAVSELPQARQILLEDTEEGPRVWTVIEAEPFDRRHREPIYQTQGELLRNGSSIEVGFRLVNVSEFGADRMASVLPSGAQTLWVRA